ncbi:hypothetical protein BKA62DRAFT_596611, partial [Auriculariales sp. MPI-PUGE-AT-0066]
KALSQTRKQRQESAAREALYQLAISRYNAECSKPPGECVGLRQICRTVEREYKVKTGHSVSLSHTTVFRRINGKQSLIEFNATKRWLRPQEEAALLEYVIEMAARGFPLSYTRLTEHANEI